MFLIIVIADRTFPVGALEIECFIARLRIRPIIVLIGVQISVFRIRENDLTET